MATAKPAKSEAIARPKVPFSADKNSVKASKSTTLGVGVAGRLVAATRLGDCSAALATSSTHELLSASLGELTVWLPLAPRSRKTRSVSDLKCNFANTSRTLDSSTAPSFRSSKPKSNSRSRTRWLS